MLPETAYVLCTRLDVATIPVRGSVVRQCRCGRDVWVAPSTFERALGHPLVLLCHACVTPDELAAAVAEVRVGPPPAVRAEIRQHQHDHPDQWAGDRP